MMMTTACGRDRYPQRVSGSRPVPVLPNNRRRRRWYAGGPVPTASMWFWAGASFFPNDQKKKMGRTRDKEAEGNGGRGML